MQRSTPLADELMARLSRSLTAARDPARAVPMAAYMRDQFPFLGIARPTLRTLGRQALAGLPRLTQADLTAVALACWERPEREYQYVACDWLRRHARGLGADFLTTARDLITRKSWWDTVDTLAAHVVGPVVAAYPRQVAVTDAWLASDDRWLVRAAILHQLTWREATDRQRLFRYCLAAAGDPDFFVRKAIGWALREYAKTDPAAVRRFVTEHRHQLAPLSVREALRRLG